MHIAEHCHFGPVIFHITLHAFPTSSLLGRLPKLSEVASSFADAVLGPDVVLLLGEVYKTLGT